jgi:pimeloyl-ACP methyl ester carboxylesterase
VNHEFVEANGIRFHCVTAGDGPLALLLHGFPQFWYAWRHQIPALASRFKVVAPDLRGYNDTAKPPHVADYRTGVLAADVAGLVRAFGYEKAHLVGHDWGGGVAWTTAMQHPEVVAKLAVLNCPHPLPFVKALRSNLRQLGRSWYMFFFQIPAIPELVFRLFPDRIVEHTFRGLAIRKGTSPTKTSAAFAKRSRNRARSPRRSTTVARHFGISRPCASSSAPRSQSALPRC